MPLFFFDIHDNDEVQRDAEGMALEDTLAARQEAVRALTSLGFHEPHRNVEQRTLSVVVRDHDGVPGYSATLSFKGLWMSRGTQDGPPP